MEYPEPFVRIVSAPCNRKCPCRLWVQCDTYKDTNERALRLAEKRYGFHEWYETVFRSGFGMHDLYMNG